MFDIKAVRDKLDLIEEDASFEQEMRETGIFEEAELLEASTLIQQFGDSDTGLALAKYLHRNYKVSNRAELVPFTHPTGNLDLMQFKTHYDNFTILKGPNGWAAFKPDERYLRPLLGTQNYNPSKDRQLIYIGIFSLKDRDDIFEKEITGTRGGSYAKKEKAEVTTPTIADQLKEYIGTKGIQVFRLMDRDDPELSTMSPELFSGSRSGDIGSPGASVERKKIDVRATKKEESSVEAIIDRLITRISRIIPNINKQIFYKRYARVESDIDKQDKFKKEISKFRSNRDELKELLEEVFADDKLLHTVSSAIQSYRSTHPEDKSTDTDVAIKVSSNSAVLLPVLKMLRDKIYEKGLAAV